MPIRILLVDDSPEFLRALSRLLSSSPEIQVVDLAYSAQDAMEKIHRSQVDLVLMDLAMPGTNGLEATRWIKALPDAPLVLILTLYDSEEYRAEADLVCADGFVSKLASDDELLLRIYELFDLLPQSSKESLETRAEDR